MNRKKEVRQSSRILLSLSLVLLVLVTVGVSYAIYDYTDLVSTENTLTTGTITFAYNNKNKITIQDNIPISDEIGKTLSNTNNVFDFKILATVGDNIVPYEITARSSNNSDMIKLYLVELDGKNEKEMDFTMNKNKVLKYSELNQTDIIADNNITEKTIYKGSIPANSKDYEKDFRLRIWISDDTDFDFQEEIDNNFTFTINVYSKIAVVNNEL